MTTDPAPDIDTDTDIDTNEGSEGPEPGFGLEALPERRDRRSGVGLVLYLPESGRFVVPYRHDGDTWWCVSVAEPEAGVGTATVVRVPDAQTATALEVSLQDPSAELPPRVFAGVWLARVKTAGGSRSRLQVASTLARTLVGRPADVGGPRVVAVDEAVRTRLVNVLYVRTLTPIQRALAGLVGDGWLADVPSDGAARYELTLPGLGRQDTTQHGEGW